MEPQVEEQLEESISTEDYLLGGRPPLITLLIMSLGPLISQLVHALNNVIGSILVAKTIGQIGVEVYGAVFVVEFVAVAFAHFLSAGISVRLSYLYGAKQMEECDQLFVDFLRLCVIFGIVTPIIVLPATKPIVHWFGANMEISEKSLEYMMPITAGCVFNYIFFVASGVVQADGHSVAYSVYQVMSLILNIGVFAPIFLIWLKTPIWGASLATILSQAVPGIIITINIFRGKYTLTPKLSMFIKKFTPETKHALNIGLSTLISQISLNLPFLLMQKYVTNAAIAINEYEDTIAVWAVVEKLYLIIGGIGIGFSNGFLNPASYAYGARNAKRLIRLIIHGLWLCTAFISIVSIFIIAMPVQISLLWSSNDSFLKLSEVTTPIMYYTSFTLGIQYIIPVVLQAMKKIFAASLLSVLTLILPVPIFSTLLYFTGDGRSNPQRIFYAYTANDLYSFVVCMLFFIKPFIILKKASQDGFVDESDYATEKPSEDLNIDDQEEERVDEDRPAEEL